MFWKQGDREEFRIGKRYGTMFHLAAWIPLGMQIADLFKFERAFKCKREEDIPSDKEEAMPM